MVKIDVVYKICEKVGFSNKEVAKIVETVFDIIKETLQREDKILIVRKEEGREKRIRINYKRIMAGKDLDSNIILKSGDTIIVP
jgi:predicted transcriptional regulator